MTSSVGDTAATEATPQSDATDLDRDVGILGGGLTGSTAGIYAARYGLDTVVFDRGTAALPRCAYLENYPGFPAGIDVDVFSDLLAAHLDEAGCDRVDDMVVAVERRNEGGFTVSIQEGRSVTTATLVAAAWYDASYLCPLDEPAMFTEQEHHGEIEERFDSDYPDDDGRTPVAGLYVAAGNGDRNDQVVVAGQGAHVARSLLEDRRHERSLSGGVAPHYDWLRPESEFSGEWAERDRWRRWFDTEIDDDLPTDRLDPLREAYIDEAFATCLDENEIDRRADRGVERLVEVVGVDRILRALPDEQVLARTNELDTASTSEVGAGSEAE